MHKEKKPVNLGKTLTTKHPGCDTEKVALRAQCHTSLIRKWCPETVYHKQMTYHIGRKELYFIFHCQPISSVIDKM